MLHPQVFQTEFRTYNPTYYEASVRAGTITVNGQQVGFVYGRGRLSLCYLTGLTDPRWMRRSSPAIC